MRQYQAIWEAIKKLPVKQELAVRVHSSAVSRVKQAVKLEKTKEVAVKKKVGMMRPGPLVIRVAADTKVGSDFKIIYFSLSWDGSKL
jgi:hypothetical protein